MVHDYTQFTHQDLSIDVNWNESVKPCKYIRFRLGGKEVIINREDFYAMMILFADEKQMDDLIPVISTRVKAIRRLIKVRAKKDMRAGEIMAFPYTYFVPEAVYERLLLDNPKEYSSPELSTVPDLGKVVNKKK